MHLTDNRSLSPKHKEFVLNFFKETVRPSLVPLMLNKRSVPDLTDKASYLAVRMELANGTVNFALIEIPSQILPRFLVLPKEGDQHFVMFLDDVNPVRVGANFLEFFPTRKSTHMPCE